MLQVGTQVVGVPQPAALAAPLQPCIITSCRTVHPTPCHPSAKTKQNDTHAEISSHTHTHTGPHLAWPGARHDHLLSGARWSSCRCHGWRCRPAAWRPPPASTAPSSRSPCRSTAASPSVGRPRRRRPTTARSGAGELERALTTMPPGDEMRSPLQKGDTASTYGWRGGGRLPQPR